MKKQPKPLTTKSGEARKLSRREFEQVRHRFRPAREVIPEVVQAYRTGTLRYRGQPARKASSQARVTVSVDKGVLDFFKARYSNWESQMGCTLKAVVESGLLSMPPDHR